MSKVFIGMPAYNGERYIEEALESLIAQSFTDWRLVISDDASTDSTERICRHIAATDKRITYIRQDKNLGMDMNFDFVLNKCDSPYFMWAGQDDVWKKDFLKTCVAILDENKEIGTAFTGMINTDSYGRLIREYPHFADFSGKAALLTVIRHLLSPEIMGKGNLMYSLIRADLAKKVNWLYPNKFAWGADVIFSFGVVAHSGVMISPQVFYKKRHGGFSNPDSTKNDDLQVVKMLTFDNPKNHMFPFGKFKPFLRGHLDVSRGTPYASAVFIVLCCRFPRALYLHLRARNYRKFFAGNTGNF